MAHLIQHMSLELLENRLIDKRKHESLYNDALLNREHLEQVMYDIGRQLVVDMDREVIAIRNFTPEDDDDLVAACGPDTPPLPSHQRASFSYFESAALCMIFSHQAATHSPNEESAWIRHENMAESLMHIFAEKHLNNEVAVEKQLRQILNKFVTFGLVDTLDANGVTSWRATRYLPIVMTPALLEEFDRSLEDLQLRMEAKHVADEEAIAKNENDNQPSMFDHTEDT